MAARATARVREGRRGNPRPDFNAQAELAKIQEHLSTPGNVVQVLTHYKATNYEHKHRGMFKAVGNSLYVQRGKHWDCIDWNPIRFGHWEKAKGNPRRRFMDELMQEKIRLGGLVMTRATAAAVMRDIADSREDLDKHQKIRMVDTFVMGGSGTGMRTALPEDTPVDVHSLEEYKRITRDENPRGNPGVEPWRMTREEFAEYSRKGSYPFGVSDEGSEKWMEIEGERDRLVGPRSGREVLSASDKHGRHFEHRWIVEAALREGKPVPSHVLADYPDLQRGTGEGRVENPKPLSEMTAGELNAYIDRLDRERSKLDDEAISAGHGDLRYSELVKLGTPLSQKFEEVERRRDAARAEVEREMGPGYSRFSYGWRRSKRGRVGNPSTNYDWTSVEATTFLDSLSDVKLGRRLSLVQDQIRAASKQGNEAALSNLQQHESAIIEARMRKEFPVHGGRKRNYPRSQYWHAVADYQGVRSVAYTGTMGAAQRAGKRLESKGYGALVMPAQADEPRGWRKEWRMGLKNPKWLSTLVHGSAAKLDIQPGMWVKVEDSGEHFWVKVTSVKGVKVHGVVDNDLVISKLKRGDRISFSKRAIEDTRVANPSDSSGIKFVLGIQGTGANQKSEVQSVLVPMGQYTEGRAAEWVKAHGFKAGGLNVETYGEYYRFRQERPGKYRTFATIDAGSRDGARENPDPMAQYFTYWMVGPYSSSEPAHAKATDLQVKGFHVHYAETSGGRWWVYGKSRAGEKVPEGSVEGWTPIDRSAWRRGNPLRIVYRGYVIKERDGRYDVRPPQDAAHSLEGGWTRDTLDEAKQSVDANEPGRVGNPGDELPGTPKGYQWELVMVLWPTNTSRVATTYNFEAAGYDVAVTKARHLAGDSRQYSHIDNRSIDFGIYNKGVLKGYADWDFRGNSANIRFSRMKQRHNPNGEDPAASLFESFHGTPSTSVETVREVEEYPDNLATLGQLVELKVNTLSKLEATIQFGGNGNGNGRVGNPTTGLVTWRVKYMRRGSEPPYPFGREYEDVQASSRAEALAKFKEERGPYVSPGYPITVSRLREKESRQNPSDGDAPVLASSPDGRQLYIVGGDQSLDLSTLKMSGKKWERDSMVLGVLDEFTYRTEKGFDNFKMSDYYHQVGEESGVQPMLVYDTINRRMYIVGGQYRVTPRGVEN